MLGAAPGPVGDLRLVLQRPVRVLLPGVRLLLLCRAGRPGGRAELSRPLPLGPVRVLLRAHRVSGVLPGVLRDLPSQLKGSLRTHFETLLNIKTGAEWLPLLPQKDINHVWSSLDVFVMPSGFLPASKVMHKGELMNLTVDK